MALIEDVITTGGAVISAARALRELGATVTTVVCAIDRSPSGASGLADEGIAVKPVLTKALLDAATRYVFGNRVAGSKLDRGYQGKRQPDHRTSE